MFIHVPRNTGQEFKNIYTYNKLPGVPAGLLFLLLLLFPFSKQKNGSGLDGSEEGELLANMDEFLLILSCV